MDDKEIIFEDTQNIRQVKSFANSEIHYCYESDSLSVRDLHISQSIKAAIIHMKYLSLMRC